MREIIRITEKTCGISREVTLLMLIYGDGSLGSRYQWSSLFHQRPDARVIPYISYIGNMHKHLIDELWGEETAVVSREVKY